MGMVGGAEAGGNSRGDAIASHGRAWLAWSAAVIPVSQSLISGYPVELKCLT